jgi:hypothetical protein
MDTVLNKITANERMTPGKELVVVKRVQNRYWRIFNRGCSGAMELSNVGSPGVVSFLKIQRAIYQPNPLEISV